MDSGARGRRFESRFRQMIFHLFEEMNQMVNKKKKKNYNNSSNSLVFGRLPQTKMVGLGLTIGY